ncbi:MAG TPA: redoxin domain-containing protein [Longimicrobiales bacterium]
MRSIRDIVDSVRAPAARAPIGFDAIAARAAAGERVLLPVEEPRVTAPRHRRGLIAAAAVAVLIAGVVVIDVPEAGAEKSELWITPEAPRAGATLSLRYRATTRLDDEARLVVRARYYTADRGGPPQTVAIGELLRTDGAWFEGSAKLPDSAVYAVLAIEDPDADFVDTNAERWQVLVHGDDGRPLFDALFARMGDVRMRNTRLADEITRSMVALYPERPGAWYFRYGEATLDIPRDAVDSVRAEFRPQLERLAGAARMAAVGPDHLWYLIMFARAMGEREIADHWRDELMERYPTERPALQQAVFRAAESHSGDLDGYLATLDSIWRSAPDEAIQAAASGWQAAQRLGRPELLLRWSERIEAFRPAWAPHNGLLLVRYPETRAEGMDRLRKGIAALDAPGDDRPLGSSAAEYEATRRRTAGLYLAALGRALLEAGRPRAALDTLDRALETGWNPELFRAVADARLALGDTAGALRAFARFVADPTTSAAFADSLRARLGAAAALDGADWQAAVAAARDELRRELLGASLNRAPLRSRLRLQEPAGAAHEVRLDEGQITVVAFWSRYCPPSFRQLDELDDIADRLTRHGVRFIGITDEEDAAAVAALFEREGLSFPTYLDPERDARNAFDNRSTPSYAVLDTNGRIRFTGHTAADIVRQVAVLGGPWGGLPQP